MYNNSEAKAMPLQKGSEDMSTKDRAQLIFDMLSEEELQGFIMLFGQFYKRSDKSIETDEERLARKKAAYERVISTRRPLPDGFDEKQELLDYFDERYDV